VTAPAPSAADTRRLGVLATAAEIFSRRGFRATSMNEIAAATGMAKPTLYHYFRSKEELLVRLYSDVLDESLESGRAIVAAAATPLEAFRELIAARVAYTCERQALLKVLFEEEHELPPDLAAEVLARRNAYEDLVTEALAGHLERNPKALSGITSKVYVNMCLGAANWAYKWYRPSGPATPAELGRQIADTLCAALRPPKR